MSCFFSGAQVRLVGASSTTQPGPGGQRRRHSGVRSAPPRFGPPGVPTGHSSARRYRPGSWQGRTRADHRDGLGRPGTQSAPSRQRDRRPNRLGWRQAPREPGPVRRTLEHDPRPGQVGRCHSPTSARCHRGAGLSVNHLAPCRRCGRSGAASGPGPVPQHDVPDAAARWDRRRAATPGRRPRRG